MMKNFGRIATAIGDVLGRSSIDADATTAVEVERLFLLPDGLSSFVSKLRTTPELPFRPAPPILQHDTFYDVRVGDRWQLAETDHHVRIRIVLDEAGGFRSGEIKVAYPGPRSNPSARAAVAEPLSEEDADRWCLYLEFLGFGVEREYRKSRVLFTAECPFGGYDVEMEADRFADHPCNGPLAARSFVSLSIETDGTQRQAAESVLAGVARQLMESRFALVPCTGNYEDYFYDERFAANCVALAAWANTGWPGPAGPGTGPAMRRG